jgi:transposase
VTERKRWVFPEVFKREAVGRARTSGMTIIAVAEDLGVHETVRRRWIARFGESTTMPPRRRPSVAASMSPSPADLAAENARLKRELHRAGTERDILEKAALIFGGASR